VTERFPPSAADLRAAFESPAPLTVGLEEEAFLLDPDSLGLVPRAAEVLERAGGDPRIKLELPAAQIEVVTPPATTVGEAVSVLAAGREAVLTAAGGIARPAVAGTHPFAAPLGRLNDGPRYDAILDEYGDVARAQLVCALQVQVAVGGADRTLAVYNALRGRLPELAALAANAPFCAGRDTGLASVRPLIAGLLPRQGLPPAIGSWEAFADALRWGAAAGAVRDPRRWWWELRPHPEFGTLELRVPDAQTTVEDAAAVAAFAHATVGSLAERHDAGDPLPAAPDWRIAENRWSACRHGLDGSFADLESGARRPARDVLRDRLAELAPVAERLGCARELAGATALLDADGAARQRAVAADGGVSGVARRLADRYPPRFAAPPPG
jgi:glutamate---cysteine ligase / carboxylate-amine ligase